MTPAPVAPVPSLEEAEPNRSYLRDELREKIEESGNLGPRGAKRLADYLWPWLEAELRAEHRLTRDGYEAELAALRPAHTEPMEPCPKCKGRGEYSTDAGQVLCECTPLAALFPHLTPATHTEPRAVQAEPFMWLIGAKGGRWNCYDRSEAWRLKRDGYEVMPLYASVQAPSLEMRKALNAGAMALDGVLDIIEDDEEHADAKRYAEMLRALAGEVAARPVQAPSEARCVKCGRDGSVVLGRRWCLHCDRPLDGVQAPSLDRERALEEEVARLRRVIERDRTRVAEILAATRKVLGGYEWLSQTRGPYAWDDDRWMEEFGRAWETVREAVEPFSNIAADLSDCPTTTEEVRRARTERALTGEVAAPEGMTETLNEEVRDGES